MAPPPLGNRERVILGRVLDRIQEASSHVSFSTQQLGSAIEDLHALRRQLDSITGLLIELRDVRGGSEK